MTMDTGYWTLTPHQSKCLTKAHRDLLSWPPTDLRSRPLLVVHLNWDGHTNLAVPPMKQLPDPPNVAWSCDSLWPIESAGSDTTGLVRRGLHPPLLSWTLPPREGVQTSPSEAWPSQEPVAATGSWGRLHWSCSPSPATRMRAATDWCFNPLSLGVVC